MWQNKAKLCPLCGEDLAFRKVGGRSRPACGGCGFVLYLNPASAAAAVVLGADRRVLLVKRAIQPFRGCWALPAGYQEFDEAPEVTAVREAREEAGVEVEVLSLLDLVFVPDDPRKPANVAFYLCRPISGEPSPGAEEEDAGWFSLDDLPSPLGFDNYERILGRLT